MDGTSAKSVTHLVPVTCWYLVLAITPALTNDENKWVTPRLRLPVPGCHCKGLDNLGLRNKHVKKKTTFASDSEAHMCTQCKAQEYNKLEVHHFLIYLFFRLHINSHRAELVRIQTRLLQKLQHTKEKECRDLCSSQKKKKAENMLNNNYTCSQCWN